MTLLLSAFVKMILADFGSAGLGLAFAPVDPRTGSRL